MELLNQAKGALANPEKALNDAANMVKNEVTDMAANALPESYYDQLELANKMLMVKKGRDKLEEMREFSIQVEETKGCSNQEFCRYFPNRFDVQFRFNLEKQFDIQLPDVNCCGTQIQGNMNSYRDILGDEQHKQERLYILNHNRAHCWLKYIPGCFFLGNLCCKPKSEIKSEDNKLLNTVEYSPLSWDAQIKDSNGSVKYILRKKWYEGKWNLYNADQTFIEGFTAAKFANGGKCSLEQASRFKIDVEFPKEFSADDKAAIIFALSKAV